MVEQEALGPERRKVLADLALKYSVAPHDSNLRAKAILSLGKSGDRRALIPLYAMALETDHPWWIWQNLTFPLAALHRPPEDPDVPKDEDAPVPRAVLDALIDLLDVQVTALQPQRRGPLRLPQQLLLVGHRVPSLPAGKDRLVHGGCHRAELRGGRRPVADVARRPGEHLAGLTGLACRRERRVREAPGPRGTGNVEPGYGVGSHTLAAAPWRGSDPTPSCAGRYDIRDVLFDFSTRRWG